MFAIESYWKADSAQDAVRLLVEHPEARLIAGGTDVLIKLREFEHKYGNLVDIHDLAELRFITRHSIDGKPCLRVGSGATFTDIAESALINQSIPMLAEAAASVAGPQIRNVGTIGGNLCNGAVSADTVAPVLALNAFLNLLGPNGTRTIPASALHTGPGKVDLMPGELLLSVDFFEEDWSGWTGHYHKYAMREAMDIATIGCAAALRIEKDCIADLRLAYSVAAPVPVRCPTAETIAKGKSVSPENREATLLAIADAVEPDVNPRSSWRAEKDFRLHIIRVLAQRVIEQCLQ